MNRAQIIMLPVAVIVPFAAAACTPDHGDATRSTVTVPATDRPSSVAGGTVGSPAREAAVPTTTGAASPDDVVRPDPSGTIYFHSPSGTFHCAIFGDRPGLSNLYLAGCQGESAPQDQSERDCRAKWGPAGTAMVLRTSGHGEFECQNQGVFVGGTTADGSGTGKVVRPVLNYGERATRGTVTCAMATTGVTCTDSNSGGGFTISREGHRAF